MYSDLKIAAVLVLAVILFGYLANKEINKLLCGESVSCQIAFSKP